MDSPSRHPFFDDRAAVPWHHSLESGAAAARATGQRLWIAVTSPDCGGSRALIERVLPKEEISAELRDGFVCVSIDGRAPEPAVQALLAQAPRRSPTPVCLYAALAPGPASETSADGNGGSGAGAGSLRLVYSTAGGRPAAVFLCDLTEARSRP
ncbi:MAG: thioredoxin family protein [Polyangia bacterium]